MGFGKMEVEQALRSKMQDKALKECDNLALKYAECASGRMTTLFLVWQCRKQVKEFRECLHQFTTYSVLEDMKKEYMLKLDGKASG